MLPSMPLISTPYKELHDVLETTPDGHLQLEISPESSSPHHLSSFTSSQSPEVLTVSQSCPGLGVNHEKEDHDHISAKPSDLLANVSLKKSSPLKHVTPILKKYSSHRKGNKKVSLISKGVISDQLQLQQGSEKQCLRPIAPKPVEGVFSSAQQQQDGNPQMDQIVQKDVGEDITEMTQEGPCGAEITNRTRGGSEEKKGSGNDEKISKEKDVSAEQRSGWSVVEKCITCQGRYFKKRLSPHLHKVQTRSNKDNEDELVALMSASTTVRSSKGRTTNVMKKKSKQLRDMESALALLTPDNPAVREEKSYGFAQAYFLKVKERLEGTEVYQEFLHIMNEFGTSIVDVSDLYKKVTTVLSQHPDLCEEFVAFLLPEQAMQCGKFMEYLMITKMRDFFRKLEIYFEKQPQQMQKIYTSLSILSNQANVSIGDVRSAILPLLKGNSLLMDNFLALLPHERPPESLMPEFEEVVLGDVDNEQLGEEDLFETLVVPDQQDAYGGDNCACTCHNSRDDKYRSRSAHCVSCGTRFIHGKVFLQTGKVLRPAKVVFDGENSSESFSRLSAKNKPKRRNRRRTASCIEAASSSKDNSPVKHVNINHSGDVHNEVNENGGANNPATKSNIKSSPLKYARTTKAKSSGTTHKGREKVSAVKTMSTSKTFTPEEKETSGHREEQKQSGSVRPSRLGCNKQIALSTKPVVLLHNIAGNINSSSLSVTVPKMSCRNSNSLQSPTSFHDKTIVSSTSVTDPTSNTGLHNAKNIILSIPTIGVDKPNPVSPTVAATSCSQDMSSHDESTILPPDTAAVDTNIRDFSTLSRVIHGQKDAKCDSVDTDRLSDNVEESAGPTVKACDAVSCEVGCISEEVMEVLDCERSSDMMIAASDTAMNDAIMLEHEEQVSDSKSAKTEQDKPDGPNQTHCNSDAASGSWTREEDKIILQMFQLDCSMEQTFIKISEQLPLRTLDEIRPGFKY